MKALRRLCSILDENNENTMSRRSRRDERKILDTGHWWPSFNIGNDAQGTKWHYLY